MKKVRAKPVEKPRLVKDVPIFPPPPLDNLTEERILRNTCGSLNPENFVEAGCAVCGQLTVQTDLTLIEDLVLDWSLLEEPGVTRTERFYLDDPIECIPGPVLAPNCDSVCRECEASMRRSKRPIDSLANYMWIGEVPWQLKDLSFAERMLVARVRHNRCVVRVSSGRGKLSSNAISFANPTIKVYKVLPPTADEMSEVLAFVFLGPCKPTEEEYKRTPMLVRRQKVKDALDWLKLNHVDYFDLDISDTNLNALPISGVPFGVDWKETGGSESTISPEQRSVDDGGVDTEGTSDGPCTFAVHGLTG
ncbi:hypothetical protein C8J57DRAFT_1071826, partial [Mycena rebaudengoi]